MGEHESFNLPPGFRFCPTDEELVLHFLYPKASLLPCYPNIIPDLDLCPHDPWQLDGKALFSEKQWYFFRQKMENQATENGFWKQLEFEEPILSGNSKKVGEKKYLVFYMGEPLAGIETNWMMQEYHLCNGCRLNSTTSYKRFQRPDCHKWVLCRVYQREESDSLGSVSYIGDGDDDSGTELSYLDEIFFSMDDDLEDISLPN